MDNLELYSTYWFFITNEEADQTRRARPATSWRYGGADHRRLERLEEAGLTMPLLWPPLQSIIDVPVSQALDDM